MYEYSKKFHTKRIGKPIYATIAETVLMTVEKCGVQPVPMADIGSSIGAYLAEVFKAIKTDPSQLVGVDCGVHVKENFLTGSATLFEHDLESGVVPVIHGGPFSVMTSWETAEHIDEKFANDIVAIFGNNLDKKGLVVFGAALPGQRGKHHVNCQLPEYWHKKFKDVGIFLDKDLTDFYRNLISVKTGRSKDSFNEHCLVRR
jgi:hypothetical protein